MDFSPQRRGFANWLSWFSMGGLTHEMVKGDDDLELRVTAGCGWTFLRNEFRAPDRRTKCFEHFGSSKAILYADTASASGARPECTRGINHSTLFSCSSSSAGAGWLWRLSPEC